MPASAPDPHAHARALVEAAVRPPLEALGVERIEVVIVGAVDVHVGYRLRRGIERTSAELLEAASMAMPAAVEYRSLRACALEDLPVVDAETGRPDAEFARTVARVHGRPWWLWASAAALVALLGFVAYRLMFQRGELVARAELAGAGTTIVRFTASEERLSLWATLDGAWTRADAERRSLRKIMPVHYEIDLVRDDRVLQHHSLDTRSPPGALVIYCTFAPDCEVLLVDLPPLTPGPIELRVTGSPRDDVTHVVDMSVNVREQ